MIGSHSARPKKLFVKLACAIQLESSRLSAKVAGHLLDFADFAVTAHHDDVDDELAYQRHYFNVIEIDFKRRANLTSKEKNSPTNKIHPQIDINQLTAVQCNIYALTSDELLLLLNMSAASNAAAKNLE